MNFGYFLKMAITTMSKLGCVVRMVVDSVLPHAESGSNAHRKDAPPFSLFFNDPLFLLQVIQLLLRVFVEGNLLNGGRISFYLIFAESGFRVPGREPY